MLRASSSEQAEPHPSRSPARAEAHLRATTTEWFGLSNVSGGDIPTVFWKTPAQVCILPG